MAVSHYMKPGITQRGSAVIVTCDPSTRRVEGNLKDGATIQLAVWDLPASFRWPIEGELWSIYRDTGVWMLGSRIQDGPVTNTPTDTGIARTKDPEPNPVEALQPGDLKLDSTNITNHAGHTLIAVDLSSISNGDTLKWDATLMRFVASP